MFKGLRLFWRMLLHGPVRPPKGYRPQDHPRCDLKCCGTCNWYHGGQAQGSLSFDDGKRIVTLCIFGYCGISSEPALTRIDKIEKGEGCMVTMIGPPTINRHFFQVCEEHLRKKA